MRDQSERPWQARPRAYRGPARRRRIAPWRQILRGRRAPRDRHNDPPHGARARTERVGGRMMEHDLLVVVMDHLRSRFYGKYRGLVKDNDDKTGRARLKVQVKSVCGEEAVWAMPC